MLADTIHLRESLMWRLDMMSPFYNLKEDMGCRPYQHSEIRLSGDTQEKKGIWH